MDRFAAVFVMTCVRLLVFTLVGLAAAPAGARKMVIMGPRIALACPRGATWDAVMKCLAPQGQAQVVKTLPNARLVHLDQSVDGKTVDAGLYLYVERGKQWSLGGMYDPGNYDYELLGIAELTIGKHTGYRLDIGQTTRLVLQPDGVTSERAVWTMGQTLFCSGLDYHCVTVVTACDVLIFGQAYWSFRGTLKIDNATGTGAAEVAGDRRNSGPFCTAVARVYLGWPTSG